MFIEPRIQQRQKHHMRETSEKNEQMQKNLPKKLKSLCHNTILRNELRSELYLKCLL